MSWPLLAKLPPLGPWVDDAACARLGEHGADVYTAVGVLDGNELDAAIRICGHCPVRQDCADYAASTTVWGLWAGVWHGNRGRGPMVRRDAA